MVPGVPSSSWRAAALPLKASFVTALCKRFQKGLKGESSHLCIMFEGPSVYQDEWPVRPRSHRNETVIPLGSNLSFTFVF